MPVTLRTAPQTDPASDATVIKVLTQSVAAPTPNPVSDARPYIASVVATVGNLTIHA
ncbi:MAG: hypothetical protein ABI351_13685 [Herbaspirillum sp.]